MALKANVPDGDAPRDEAAETAQENDHLLHLAKAGALDPAYRIDDGP